MRWKIQLPFELKSERAFLRFLLLLALVHGLLYVFLVPPWQHYDEPGRFEHAWLIANRPGLPELGDEVPAMRRELLASMIAHNFFEYQSISHIPPLITNSLPWIGISQLGHDASYYSLVALPLRLFRYADLTTQLYVGRLVSFVLYLATVWIAWELLGDLLPSEFFLVRRTTALVLVLLPSFVDIMTMVGDDVGAIFIFSLFLWGCVRILRRGMSPLHIFWVIVTAGLSVLTKNTLALTPLWVLFVFTLALVRKPIIVWGLVLSIGILFLASTFTWGDAVLWERHTFQTFNTSQQVANAPAGMRAFVLTGKEGSGPAGSLQQFVPHTVVEVLQGQPVTLGAWIWTSHLTDVQSPTLVGSQNQQSEKISVDTEPTFYTFTSTIRSNVDQIGLILHAPIVGENTPESVALYYDDLTLRMGPHVVGSPHTMHRDDADRIDLSADFHAAAVNYLRNASAERTGIRVRPWFERWFRQYVGRLPMAMSIFLNSILDWERTHWIYKPVFGNLFQTFWAVFGWGNVRFPPYAYKVLNTITVFSVAGAVRYIGSRLRDLSPNIQRTLCFLFILSVAIWLQALLRVHPVHGRDVFIPAARYVYPVIVPTVLALSGGWLAWGPSRYRKSLSLLIGVLMSGLALLAVYQNVLYYYY